MLLRQMDQGMLAIAQPTHAWLCGIMAEAWGNEEFAAPRPRQAVLTAAALHDIGWLDWEMRPDFDPHTGWPRVFADVPAEVHTQLWTRGVEHAGAYGLYVETLVSMHGDTIYDKTFDAAEAQPEAAAAVKKFRRQQLDFRARSRDALRRSWGDDAGDERLSLNKRLIAAWDTISLQLCWGIGDHVSISDVPVSGGHTTSLTLVPVDEGKISVDPWPFASSTLDLRIEGRVLSGRFDGEPEMTRALKEAARLVVPVTLRPRPT